MPHAAVFLLGGAVVAVGAAILINEVFIQPALDRRREEREEEEMMNRAMAMSLQEYDQQQQYGYSSHYREPRSSEVNPWQDPFSSPSDGLRHRHAHSRSVQADNVEMQERPRDVLFDAGPISRADAASVFETPLGSRRSSISSRHSNAHQPTLLDIDDAAIRSPSSASESLAGYSVIQPDYQTSRSHTPSPTPTIRSMSDTSATILSRPRTPIDRSTVSSPFSEISAPAHPHFGIEEDNMSAWSDLGEDSSDSDDEGGMRRPAQNLRTSLHGLQPAI